MAYDDPYFPQDDQEAALRVARQQLADRKAERPAYEMTENAPQTDATPQGLLGRGFAAVTGGRNLENDISNIRSRLPSGEDYGQALLNQRDVTQEFNNLSGQNLREGYANRNLPQMALGYGQGVLGFVNPALAPINAGFDVLSNTAAKFDPRAKAEADVIGLVGTEGSSALNKGMKIAREMAAEHPFLATAIPAALGHNALPESTEAVKPAAATWQIEKETGLPQHIYDQGYTIPAYHATVAEKDFAPGSMKDENGFGVHFGSKEAANDRLSGRKEELGLGDDTSRDRILPVAIKLKKPLELEDVGEWSDKREVFAAVQDVYPDISKQFGVDKSKHMWPDGSVDNISYWNSIPELPEIKKFLQKKGHDGIVYENQFEGDGGNSYIVFDPKKNVKSQFDLPKSKEPEPSAPVVYENPHANPNSLGLYSRAQRILEEMNIKEGTELQAIINQMKNKDNSVVKELSDAGITDKKGTINPDLIEAYKAYPIQNKDDLIALLRNVSPEHVKEIVFKSDTKNYSKNLEGADKYLKDIAENPQQFKDFLEEHNVPYDHDNWIDADKHARYDYLVHNHLDDAEHAVQNRSWVYPRSDESVGLFARDLATDRNEFENFVNDNEMPGVLAGNPRRDAELDHAMSENGTFEDRMRYLENYHRNDLMHYIEEEMIAPQGHPQYEQYTMPGGANYQERIGYLDPAQYGTLHTNADHSYDLEFRKGDENRLYQTRVKDYLNNEGNKVRFIDEVQNDQATAASKEGISEPLSNFKKLTPERLLETQGDRLYRAQRNELEVIVNHRKNYAADLESAKYLRDEPAIARIEKDLKELDKKYKDLLESENTKGVSVDHYIGDNPSNTEWRKIALKRELIDAVKNGMDKLAVNNGLNISKRWDKNFKKAYDGTMTSDLKSILNELDPKFVSNLKQEDAGLNFARAGNKYGYRDRHYSGEPGYVNQLDSNIKINMAKYFDAPGIHKKENSLADEKAAMKNWWNSMDDATKDALHEKYLKKVDEMNVVHLTPELKQAILEKGFKHRKSGGRVGKAGGGLSFGNIATQDSEGETNADGTPKTSTTSPVVPIEANNIESGGGGGNDGGRGGNDSGPGNGSQAGGGGRDSNNADSTGTTGGNAEKRGGRVSKMQESEHNVIKRALTLSNHGSPLSDAMRIARQHRGRP